MTNIAINITSVEQFLGIIPIDEELETATVDINIIKTQVQTDINSVKTRKDDSYYENLKEKEGAPPERTKYPDPTIV